MECCFGRKIDLRHQSAAVKITPTAIAVLTFYQVLRAFESISALNTEILPNFTLHSISAKFSRQEIRWNDDILWSVFYGLKKLPWKQFLNCYLAVQRPPLGLYRGENLTHSIYITVLFNFDPKVTGSLVK